MDFGLELTFIIIALILSAFFSGTEIAFVSANKLHFEFQRKKGKLAGIIIAHFFQKPSRFIATMLVGNTISLVVYGIFMADLLDPVLTKYVPNGFNTEINILIIQSVLSTLLVLVTAEFLPKAIFRLNPDLFLDILAVPIALIYGLLYPIVLTFVGTSKFLIVYIIRLPYSEDKPVYRLVDINNYINNTTIAENTNQDSIEIDTKIFNNAISFKNIKIRDCMTQRMDLVGVDVKEGIEGLKTVFLSSGHSKIIVYENSIDEVKGYCHTSGLFQNPKEIKDILTEMFFVPESTLAQELLVRFIAKNRSIALVVDEFGATAGIVTLEDIMEEIFGDIEDEHDEEELIQQIDDYTYLIPARQNITQLNEKYQFKLPENQEYDTLGGFILHILESIPKQGQVVIKKPYTFTITEMQYSRIDKIKMRIDKEFWDNNNKENNKVS